MNAPVGFRVEDGRLVDIDPLAALGSPYAAHEIPHMAIASYLATAGAVAGIHALALLRKGPPELHRRALGLALAIAVPCALVQPLVGHFAGQRMARLQPAKLAATEGLERTQARAPLSLGPLRIPAGLSILAFNDPDAVVKGLEEFAPEDRPPALVRPAFLVMVGLGTLLAGHGAWALALLLRRRSPLDSRAFLAATVAAAPLGFVALEAGWILTEVGRQPWVVYGVIRTASTVTPAAGLGFRLVVFTSLYLVLGATVAVVLARHVRKTLERAP
jgi:cytochrome d ubiquinol oxidase subunit I